MVITKFFISFIKEKNWLEQMNKKGYELKKRSGFVYMFEKTDTEVLYEYVFLKNGKRSYCEFDYKSKDTDAKAIYGNADMFLLKKPKSKGKVTVFQTLDEKKLNAAKKKAALNSTAALYIGVCALCAALIKIITPLRWVFLAVAVVFMVMSLWSYYLSYNIGKYVKLDKI